MGTAKKSSRAAKAVGRRKKPAPKAAGRRPAAPRRAPKKTGDQRKTELKRAEREARLRDALSAEGLSIDSMRGPGRPTEYDPRFCDLIVEWTRKTGKSFAAFAGVLRVSRSRLNDWAAAHPEFQEAMATAKAARALVLETQAMTDDKAGPINLRVLALKNCAEDDWREAKDVRLGGLPDAPPIETKTTTNVNPFDAYMVMLHGGAKTSD